jgi:hypothetical protein
MDQSSHETTGISLPPPVAEQIAPHESASTAVEESVANVELSRAAEQAPAAPPVAPPLNLPMQNPVAAQTDDVITTSSTVVSDVTDDQDLIEKEWVNKAKAIVERNRDNPYKQSEELTVVKAEYLKKRYDKTIKVGK